jgi:putative transposase
LIQRIHTLSECYPRFGYWKIYYLLKAEQWGVNRETVRRIRKHEGLQVIRKACKRRPMGTSTTTPTRAAHPNHVWSSDFGHDETTDGRRLKCLTVLDEYTREGLAIYCARSITADDVVQVLQRLFAQHGAPGYVKSDNGPEFIAQRVTTWLHAHHVDTHFIEPGSPWQNGHNESFNGVFRDGCLNRWLFTSVQEARRIISNWLKEYNHERPHGALDGLTPRAFAAQCRSQSLVHAA